MKALLSALSAVLGWAAGFLYYATYMTFFTPWGRPTDVQAMLFWSGVFVSIAWLLAVLPFVLLVDETSKFLQLPGAVIVGAIGGLVSFLLLVGWWTGFWTDGLYLVYALVVGATTGAAYVALMRLARRAVNPAA